MTVKKEKMKNLILKEYRWDAIKIGITSATERQEGGGKIRHFFV